MSPQPPPAAPPPIQPIQPRPAAFDFDKLKGSLNWEQFMGAKLFAWIGGLALFLGVAYFVKYSFEHNLIPPEVRVALGFLVGIGLVAGGTVMRRREYAITAHTLCATGIVILYAVTFACRAVYHFPFFGPVPTFGWMALVTAAAFLLALRLSGPGSSAGRSAGPVIHAQTLAPSERITFQEAIQRAVNRNPSSATAAAGIVRAAGLVRQARAATALLVTANVTTTTVNRSVEFDGTVVAPRNQVTALTARLV